MVVDPEIKQIKSRLENMESMWIECERKLDYMLKKYDALVNLIEKDPGLL